jgi:hypothetical protein
MFSHPFFITSNWSYAKCKSLFRLFSVDDSLNWSNIASRRSSRLLNIFCIEINQIKIKQENLLVQQILLDFPCRDLCVCLATFPAVNVLV